MIYIGAEDGIYRWSQGAPWPVFHALQNKPIVRLASPGSGIWVVFDEEGEVLESRDNGLSWRTIPLPEAGGRPSTLAVSGGVPSTIVLATRTGALFFRQIGSVAAWTRLPDLPVGKAVGGSGPRLIAQLQPTSPIWHLARPGDGLWRSEDSGSTWSRCPGVPDDVFAIRSVASAPGLVVTGTSKGVWISDDGGASWSDRSQGLGQSLYVGAVEIDPDNPDYLLAGSAPAKASDPAAKGKPSAMGFALYESKDRGKTWTHVRRGFPDLLEFESINDIRFDPAATEFAVVAFDSGELWRTRNGGDWWEPLARQINAARVLAVTP